MVIHESNGLDALHMVHKLELAPHCQKVADERAGACYKRLCGSSVSPLAEGSLFYQLSREALVAGRTLEWLLICMGRHMPCQMFMTGEGVRADLAGILPRRCHCFKTIETR